MEDIKKTAKVLSKEIREGIKTINKIDLSNQGLTESEQESIERLNTLIIELQDKLPKRQNGLIYEEIEEDKVTGQRVTVQKVAGYGINQHRNVRDGRVNTQVILEGRDEEGVAFIKGVGIGIDYVHYSVPRNGMWIDGGILDEASESYIKEISNQVGKRVKLGRKVLKESGYMGINCTDRNVEYVKLILEQEFGKKNYIGTFLYEVNKRGNKQIGNKVDYYVVYAKNKEQCTIKNGNGKADKDEQFPYEDSSVGINGKYRLQRLDKKKGIKRYEDSEPYVYKGDMYYAGQGLENSEEYGWEVNKEVYRKLKESGRIEVVEKGGIKQLRYKDYEYINRNGERIDRKESINNLWAKGVIEGDINKINGYETINQIKGEYKKRLKGQGVDELYVQIDTIPKFVVEKVVKYFIGDKGEVLNLSDRSGYFMEGIIGINKELGYDNIVYSIVENRKDEIKELKYLNEEGYIYGVVNKGKKGYGQKEIELLKVRSGELSEEVKEELRGVKGYEKLGIGRGVVYESLKWYIEVNDERETSIEYYKLSSGKQEEKEYELEDNEHGSLENQIKIKYKVYHEARTVVEEEDGLYAEQEVILLYNAERVIGIYCGEYLSEGIVKDINKWVNLLKGGSKESRIYVKESILEDKYIRGIETSNIVVYPNWV